MLALLKPSIRFFTLSLLIVLSAHMLTASATPQTGLNFSFTLDKSYHTSAGAYKTDGTLVKTLWKNVVYDQGKHSELWDGTDDNGKAVANGDYQIKLIYHNVKYTWNGVIGNTSRAKTGPHVHRAFSPINSMAFSGTNGYYTVGYNEQQPYMHWFDTSNIQSKTVLNYNNNGFFSHVVTDDNFVYWAARGHNYFEGTKTHSWVVATPIGNAEGKLVNFSDGHSFCGQWNGPNCYSTQYWHSVIDDVDGVDSAISQPTGLAVQKSGSLLFVAHGGLNALHILNKSTGKLIAKQKLTNVRALAATSAGQLWAALQENGTWVVRKFNVGADASLTPVLTIKDLSEPMAMAMSPDSSTLLVADGGTSQQIKAFSNTNGSQLWTYGVKGGYANSPDVTDNKFDFRERTFVAYQSDGSFWVGDTGNSRVQHYTGNRSFVDRIAFSPASYAVSADPKNPTRVFNRYWEYKVDYSKSLGGTNGSWTLLKNWGHLPSSANQDYHGWNEGFQAVVKLKNGRTYGLIPNSKTGKLAVVELPPSGNARITGIELPNATFLYGDGSYRYVKFSDNMMYAIQRNLTGFDTAGNPQWGPESTMASALITSTDPYYRSSHLSHRLLKSPSGVVVTFGEAKYEGYHLGGIKGSHWVWKASPSINNTADTSKWNGDFQIGNGVINCGNISLMQDRNIILGYQGEFWNGGQANQFMHFYDNGLFVGQFGQFNAVGPNNYEAIAATAGNAFSPTLVTVNGVTYMWHNDENAHAGVHRWQLDGLNDIHEVTGTGSLGGSVNLSPS